MVLGSALMNSVKLFFILVCLLSSSVHAAFSHKMFICQTSEEGKSDVSLFTVDSIVLNHLEHLGWKIQVINHKLALIKRAKIRLEVNFEERFNKFNQLGVVNYVGHTSNQYIVLSSPRFTSNTKGAVGQVFITDKTPELKIMAQYNFICEASGATYKTSDYDFDSIIKDY